MSRRSPEAQAQLDRAVAAIDRELAADLEMTSMFDQTKQAFVLENGQFERHRATIERELPVAYMQLADLYTRIPATESAMERRGPAASIKEEDRAIVNEWEGDAREAQRALREWAAKPPPSTLETIIENVTQALRRLIPRGR